MVEGTGVRDKAEAGNQEARRGPNWREISAKNRFSPAGEALKGKLRAVQRECNETVKIWALFNLFRRQGMGKAF
jgi:hypothetical protein